MEKFLYADESGNMDFRCHETHQGATKYFAMGSLMMEGEDNMKRLRSDIAELRYDLVRQNVDHDGHFHATSDSQDVRNAMFELLQDHDFKIDVTLLEKSKAQPQTRSSEPRFYKTACYFHFKHCAPRYFRPDDDLMVVSAGLGTKKTRAAFRTAVQDVMNQCCPGVANKSIGFLDASTDAGLQAVDYALWAVMREQERGDKRSRVLVEDKINSVYDLWSVGRKHFYGRLAA